MDQARKRDKRLTQLLIIDEHCFFNRNAVYFVDILVKYATVARPLFSSFSSGTCVSELAPIVFFSGEIIQLDPVVGVANRCLVHPQILVLRC